MQNPGFYRWTLKNDKKHQLDKSDNMRHNVGRPDKKRPLVWKIQGNSEAGTMPVFTEIKERMIFMSKKIRLNATEDVKEFVKAASKCDFDVDISYNRILIDAKSILGILSMDLTKVLTVTCHGENHEFNCFLQKYAVA